VSRRISFDAKGQKLTRAVPRGDPLIGGVDDLFRLIAKRDPCIPKGGCAVLPPLSYFGIPHTGLHTLLLTALIVSLAPRSAGAQGADRPPAPVAPDVISRDAARRATVRAIRLTEPLQFDGALDDAVYQRERSIDGFIQNVPKEGAPATERTEAWILFDSTHIYISARCWDSSPPSAWIVSEMRRDTVQLRQNETFGVMLDTFNDRRNGLIFYANPLGARADFAVTDETSSNFDWNPIWDVRTGRFDGGWTIEMAIPFKSVRYVSGADLAWGVQLRRTIRHKNEWTHLTPVPASNAGANAITQISLAAALVGLEVPPATRNIELKPYAISRLTTDRLNKPAVVHDFEPDAGVDLRYSVTANLTADFTYNTDFAQVEVDEQQVNLTRFNLVFPEKRDFFLEGRGIFDFGHASGNVPSLFYSRRIGLNNGRTVPIVAGGRLTGKVGKYSVGLVNLQTSHVPDAASPGTNFGVVRIKRDILRRSSVGAIFTNRSVSNTGAGTNQAYGADAAFAFYRNITTGGYVARSQTPGLRGDDVSYQGRFEYGADRYGARADYLHVGEHFNPEVGFMRRTNFDQTSGELRFSPRPRRIKAVRKFTWESSVERIASGDGWLESGQVDGTFVAELENSDSFRANVSRNFERLVRPFAVARGVTIAPGAYRFANARVSYAMGPHRRISGTVALQRGQFYDGHLTVAEFSSARVGLGHRLSIEPTLSMNHAVLPAGTFTTAVIRTRSDFAFTTRMFATGLVQYGSGDRTFSSNIRFRWEYLPGSEFFAVYTDERDTSASLRGLRNRAFVLKITRVFRF
jgi:hypothetical protein